MTEHLIRAYEARVDDAEPKERTIVSRINASTPDRYKTVILASGIDLGNYRKNPVVLFEHGKDPTRGALPVGKNVWIKAQGNGLVAKTQFAKDDYSQTLFDLYRDGVMAGWSVNVLPDLQRSSPPTHEELRTNPDWATCSMIYRGTELAEYSSVTVPGHPDALTVLEARGIWIPDEARAILGEVAKPFVSEPVEDEELDEEFRYIRKKGSQWIVYSESGKVLGTHKDRMSAVKQLQAIEAHKHDKGRAFEAIHEAMVSEFRSLETRLVGRIKDTFDLMRGRV